MRQHSNRPSREAISHAAGTGRDRARRSRRRPTLEGLEGRCLPSLSALAQQVSFDAGVASGPAVLATFLDTDPSPPVSYAATIDWGDGGPTSAGAVSLSGGTYSVTGSHTYAKQGYFPVEVPIQESNGQDQDFAQVFANDTVSGSPLYVSPAPLSTVAGQALGNVLVATFTDADPGGTPASYAAIASWGDGETTSGAIAADPTVPGQFDVSSTKPQPYIMPGSATVSVTVTDLSAGSSSAAAWTGVASLPGARRAPSVATGPNGLIYTFGGVDSNSNPTSEVDAYNPATDTWTTVASLPSVRSYTAAAAGPDGRIYAMGGLDANNHYSSEVDAYDPTSNTWTVVASLPVARADLAAATGPDGRIYAIGGIDGSGYLTGEVDAYSPATNTWTRVASLPTARNFLGVATGPDGRIYAIGGLDQDSQPTGEVDAYNPFTNLWTVVASLPGGREQLAAATGPDGRIYAIGGNSNSGLTSEVDAYDTATSTWTVVAPLPVARFDLGAATGPDGRIYAMGGIGNNLSTITSEVDAYAPLPSNAATSSRQVTVATSALYVSPAPLSPVAGQALGNVVVASFTDADAGGTPASYTASVSWGDGELSPGTIAADPIVAGRFDVIATKPHPYAAAGSESVSVTVSEVVSDTPAVNTWNIVAALPVARSEPATVTGPDGRIYAIGGLTNNNTFSSEVDVYDPATNAWSAVASLPTARWGVSAAAGPDGRIYAMGGLDANNNYSSEVDAYDPRTNTWTIVASLPSARWQIATATGPDGRIYAIGGEGIDGATNEVDAYDPATNTWTRPVGLPTGRTLLAAVTGPDGRIYAIGGSEYLGNRVSEVDAYNPGSNKWTVVANLPTARYQLAAAVGADGRIYAIAGIVSYTITGEVDAYDPATNTWTVVASLPDVRNGLGAATGPDGRIYAISGLDGGGYTTEVAAYTTVPIGATSSTVSTINVVNTMPVLTWPNPAAITYGTALGAAQLDATASVPGTFSYSPKAGTVLNAGAGQTLSVTFTPSDATDYSVTTASVTINVLPATPVLTWANPAAITYGTALGAAQLDATASVAGTFSYSPKAGTVLSAGAGQTLSVTFTPSDATDYTVVTTTATIDVLKATRALIWPSPADITYGTPLGPAQLDATSPIPGTFSYTPPSGTVLHAGSGQVVSVTFTPADAVDYNVVTSTVPINVAKATPVVTWPSPADITYGTALGSAQLDASSSIPGSFSYTATVGTVLHAGAGQVLAVTFTPADAADYISVTTSVPIDVLKATPTVTWPTPADIIYGTALGAAQLDATASVAGSFSYGVGTGTVLPAGTGQLLSVTFIPADAADYSSVTTTTTITVLKAIPAVTWLSPADITYSTALGAAQLDATASVPGTFSYTPAAGTVLHAGAGQLLSATFTPTDAADYSSVTATTLINVLKANPVLSWPNPAAITYGTALGAAQLDATASVGGSFSYGAAAGTVLPAGSGRTLSVTFTPADAADYNGLTTTAAIDVLRATPVISWPYPSAIAYGTPLGPTQLDATTSTPGTFTYAPPAGTVLPSGPGQVLSVVFTPNDAANYTPALASTVINVLTQAPSPTPTPSPAPAPARTPTFLGESDIITGVGRKKIVGHRLNFSAPLDSGTAQDVGHFHVVQPGRSKRSAPKSVPVLSATYDSGTHSITLMLGKSTRGKPLTLTATGLVGAGGEPIATIITNL
jgi:N-acetylneuraminic acid mutarotase